MIIQNDITTSFKAKKNPLLENGRKNIKNIISNNDKLKNNNLYIGIDEYINKKCDKETYLNSFIKNLRNKNFPKNLKNSEKTYINDLKTSIDLAYNLKDIPESYLLNRIQQLLLSLK